MAFRKHLSFEERLQIEALVKDQVHVKEIAKRLGRAPKIIYADMKRVPHPYSAKEAQLEFETFYMDPRYVERK